ncbi:uncharacterized protein LOC111699140 [Eurytemora carolleeae]|uniref:uncharacterized protein LOC111699140 n=1 Tax=Eurytemora carolleeae TaxID=1294199 RepID=UPI000C789D1D|nr:uncharacterized protein LOC111699140 [Eurytemora carolleeae]XP_023325494.1 uncharacterized protein LOC111699140 [Eurytemora carolleeae]|eukprot:XP_023325493.1 uncharacterized protein LOC111699140 [Eurytemora affinis]
MGCSGSKAAGSPMMRMLEYERMAENENAGLKIQPNSLKTEEWREGLISTRTFYNWFHAGYCSAYIQNPLYMLILDFRSVDDWLKERVPTSVHYERLHLYQQNLDEYSQILLYDKDGCSVGNIKSPLRKSYLRLRGLGLDPRIVLGGFKSLQESCFSSLRKRTTLIPFASQVELMRSSVENIGPERSDDSDIEDPEYDLELIHPAVGRIEPERRCVPWLPSMIIKDKLYLGRVEQAEDPNIIRNLGITHILSTARVRSGKIKGIVYIIVNKTSFSLSTLKLTNSFISEALSSGGRILVHGCDGLDQSAAVITSALMSSYSVSLEDSLGFVENSRPGVRLSNPWLRILLKLEEEMFGLNITDIETLWV